MLTGKGNFSGWITLTYTIAPSGSTPVVELSQTEYEYDGNAKTPTVTVKLDGKTLTDNQNYTVTYQNNTDAGTATATVTSPNWVGEIKKDFNISKKPLTDLKIVDAGKEYDGTKDANNSTISCNGIVDADQGKVEIIADFKYDSADAGEKTITASNITLSGEKSGNYIIKNNPNQITGTGTIKPVSITVTVDEIADQTYTGQPITPAVTLTITNGSTVGQEVLTLNRDYTVSYSANTNVGDASITINAVNGSNYTVSGSGSFQIVKATPTVTPPTAKELTYTGTAQALVTEGTVSGGTMQYKLGEDGEWSVNVPTATNASTYTVYYKIVGNSNHLDMEAESVIVTIKKATYDMTAAKWDYTETFDYDGLEKRVSVVGLPDGVTVENYTGNTATVVGDYTAAVTFRYDSNNYIEPTLEALSWSIQNNWEPADEYTVSAPNSNGWLNADFVITAKDGYELSFTNTADGDWRETRIGAVEGADSSVTFYVRDKQDGRISLATTEYYSLDKTVPTGTITIGELEGWKEFLNEISFGLFYKDMQTVTITGEDLLSGVASVEYYASAEAMTQNALMAADGWTEYTSELLVDVEDAKTFVYFARITDKAGNVTYLSTDGAEYDTSDPVVTGIENGKNYYTTQKVTVTDKNLASVTLNGDTVFPLNDEPVVDTLALNDEPAAVTITLEGNKAAAYTIEATDKAGNITTVTVYMAPIADITDGMADMDSAEVTSDDMAGLRDILDTVTELLEDEDLTPEEKDELTAAQTDAQTLIDAIDAAQNALDTESVNNALDVTTGNVTPEDKTDLENAIADMEKALEEHGGNYTDEEKQNIQEAIGGMEEILEFLENVEAVADMIDALPDTVTKEDEAAVNAAQEAYNALTDHGKSLISAEEKKTLDDAVAAIAELNKAQTPVTGDAFQLGLWACVMAVSAMALAALLIVKKKRITAK